MSEETITGELVAHRVVGESFWSIATVRLGPGAYDGLSGAAGNTVPAVGKLLGAQLGDTVELEGYWDVHKKFGRQFKVRTCRVVVPQSDNGVIAWLSMRLPNVGRGRARAMLDHFGGAEALWRVVEDEPARLVEVAGITAERADQIVDAYVRFRAERDRMIRFRRWGLTPHQVSQMLMAWGDDAEAKLRDNPYELAKHVDGFGFLRADVIAERMGVPRDSVPRIECGLHHTMEQATGHGHVYVATGKLVKLAAEKVLRLDGDKVALHLAIMRKRGDFVQHGKRTFTRRLNRHEQRCADAVRAFLAQRKEG